MTDDSSFHVDIKDCIHHKGVLYIPLPELFKLFEKFPYFLGKDFKEILEKANTSDKIQETENGK